MDNKRSGMPRITILIMFLLIAGMLYYSISGMLQTSHYKYNDFQKDLSQGKVKSVTINQNKEIPTGQIIIKLKDNSKEEVYVTDVNKVIDEIVCS